MTRREEREIALERIMDEVSDAAADRGHLVLWEREIGTREASAAGRCDRCGLTAAARVYSDGRDWSAGKLRSFDCTAAP